MPDHQPDPAVKVETVAEDPRTIRTAIVIVHGMGEQRPLETLYRFVKTALSPVRGARIYYSRPERLTDSYEARRCLAPRLPRGSDRPALQPHLEFFEYHWSYLMSDNKISDLFPTTLRLLLRPTWSVPYGLRVVHALTWLLIWGIIWVAVVLGPKVAPEEWSLAAIVGLVVGQGLVATLIVRGINALGVTVTNSFADVVRYLDSSPRSYENRRDIREGMVDLLTALHDKGRYSRVIVAAHSLGAYIAYDAIAYLWPQMANLHDGPLSAAKPPTPIQLTELEEQAKLVFGHPDSGLDPTQQGELDEFQLRQFDLWRAMRSQGNPWLITDFVTFGTPMYFADRLYTRNREQFDDLVRTAQFPVCPPRRGSQQVEQADLTVGHYGWNNQGKVVLSHNAPFAVVRWTNLFFPADFGFFGDWFGGRLRPLFGRGIVDKPVLGNKWGRRAPGIAHGRYLSYPDVADDDGIARAIQAAMFLNIEDQVPYTGDVPEFLEATDVVR